MACTCWAPECVCGRGPRLGPRRAGREADLSPCPSLPDDSAAGPSRSTASHEGRGTRQGGRPCNSRFLREVVPDPGELPARARRVRKNTTPRGPRGPAAVQPRAYPDTSRITRNPCDRPVPLRAFTGAVAITAHITRSAGRAFRPHATPNGVGPHRARAPGATARSAFWRCTRRPRPRHVGGRAGGRRDDEFDVLFVETVVLERTNVPWYPGAGRKPRSVAYTPRYPPSHCIPIPRNFRV